MKSIDIKSLIIGALLTTTIILGCSATSPTDKWDNNQKWEIKTDNDPDIRQGRIDGFEPFGYATSTSAVMYRKRIK